MGLFDKKFCDVCGEKIGLLGNRKLDDGNLCKDCAAKLSPFFSGRRRATVEDIKAQLAYREENRRALGSFRPTRTFGDRKKVYIDDAAGKFIVTSRTNWQETNPDIIALSQITAVNTDIKEHKDELFRETSDGKRMSYSPPRYEYSYEFDVEILVNSPWFGSIEWELSDGNRPESRYTDAYREYERQLYELKNALLGMGGSPAYGQQQFGQQAFGQAAFGQQQFGQAAFGQQQYGQQAFGQQQYAQPDHGPNAYVTRPQAAPAAGGTWTCSCGTVNSGNFCQGCGGRRPEAQRSFRCDKCGWQPAPGEQPPRFCPQCGDPFDANDLR